LRKTMYDIGAKKKKKKMHKSKREAPDGSRPHPDRKKQKAWGPGADHRQSGGPAHLSWNENSGCPKGRQIELELGAP